MLKPPSKGYQFFATFWSEIEYILNSQPLPPSHHNSEEIGLRGIFRLPG